MPIPFLRKAYRAVKKVFKGRRRVVARKPRRKFNRSNQILRVRKVVKKDRVNVVGGTTLFAFDTFELSDIPQYAAYAGLYEEYRIDKVVCKYVSLNNMALANQTALNTTLPFVSLGMIHTAIDTNDSTVPTSIQDMMNDSTYRGTRSSQNHTRALYPKFLNVVAGAVQAQSSGGWLKTENDNISHYGIKIALEGGSVSLAGATSYIVEPIITYYLSFKNPK